MTATVGPGAAGAPSPPEGRRYFRSVRLERDFADPRALEGYVLTAQGRSLLSRIEEGLCSGGERAFTLTGPYGSGKSAFALFAARVLTGSTRGRAWSLLESRDPGLAGRLSRTLGGRGLLPVILTLRRAPLAQAVLEGLAVLVGRLGERAGAQALAADLAADLRGGRWDTRVVLERCEAAAEFGMEFGPHRGLLVVLDELGKALEHAARHTGEDIYLLQELAELAARSGDRPVLLLGVLHQGFEQYAESLALAARREWGKVQGRFADVPFLEPSAQQVRLAAQASANLDAPERESFRLPLEAAATALEEAGFVPSEFERAEFAGLAGGAYPLHPAVLAALPHLFRRYAQNERSLFAYLLSGEPAAPGSLLIERGPGLVRLPDLFDYFTLNLSGSLARHAGAKRWLEVQDALDRHPDLGPMEAAVLKTVGLLNILGEASPLRATEALVSAALTDNAESAEVRAALTALGRRGILHFRRVTGTFQVWEGSDVDVEAKLDEGRSRLSGRFSLAQALGEHLPRRPAVARRHSHETGALRYHELRYLDVPVGEKDVRVDPGSDALILVGLPASVDGAAAFLDWAREPWLRARPDLVVVVPRETGRLREATTELQAIAHVWKTTPELRDDRVARRELTTLTALVEGGLSEAVERLLDPRPEPVGSGAAWFFRGERQDVSAPMAAARLLSQAMDELYPLTPRVRNELINRRSLSSAAAAARNALLKGMLERGHEPQLGLEGFPPERSMYESLLRATGIHRQLEPDRWGFGRPLDQAQRLGPGWEELERAVFAALEEPLAVSDLFGRLAAPPYGLMPGVLPVLLVALLLAYPNEVSLYREGAFVPEPSVADLEVLVRRPELFAVAGGRVIGERVAVVNRLAARLGTPAATLPVVRSLVRMARSLPEHAWRTSEVEATVLGLRGAFDRARAPEKLLYHDLPLALGQLPFRETGDADPARVESFFGALNVALQSWANVVPARVEWARDRLLEACGEPRGAAGFAALRAVARSLEGKVSHAMLVPLVQRLVSAGDDASALESVLAQVAGRPVRTWTDADVQRFPAQAEAVGTVLSESKLTLGVLSGDEVRQSAKVYENLKGKLAADVPKSVLRAALARWLQELQ